MVGLIAAAEQVKELGPSEDDDLEQMMDHGLGSTQVKLAFDLIHIKSDLTFLYSFLIITFFLAEHSGVLAQAIAGCTGRRVETCS